MSRPLGVGVIVDGVDEAGAARRLAAIGVHVMRGECLAPTAPLPEVVAAHADRAVPCVRLDGLAGRVWTGRGWRARAVLDRGVDGTSGDRMRRTSYSSAA